MKDREEMTEKIIDGLSLIHEEGTCIMHLIRPILSHLDQDALESEFDAIKDHIPTIPWKGICEVIVHIQGVDPPHKSDVLDGIVEAFEESELSTRDWFDQHLSDWEEY